MMNKSVVYVKFKYFELQYLINLKRPACISRELAESLINWNLNTSRQFVKNLFSIKPTNFFMSATLSNVESTNLSAYIDKQNIQKLLDNFNKLYDIKISKFRLIVLLPFILEFNTDMALNASLSFFILENENMDRMTREEIFLFLDSYFSSINEIVQIEEIDEVYTQTRNKYIKLSEEDLKEIMCLIFSFDNRDEISIEEILK